MAAWRADETVAKAEAITKIKEMAKAKGYKGAFKVFYDGEILANPSDLPAQVEMSKITLSAVMDQAAG